MNMEESENKGCFFENRIYPEGAAVCDLDSCRVCRDGMWVDRGEKTVVI
jgi:Zn-finger nucleic acid-binding protein